MFLSHLFPGSPATRSAGDQECLGRRPWPAPFLLSELPWACTCPPLTTSSFRCLLSSAAPGRRNPSSTSVPRCQSHVSSTWWEAHSPCNRGLHPCAAPPVPGQVLGSAHRRCRRQPGLLLGGGGGSLHGVGLGMQGSCLRPVFLFRHLVPECLLHPRPCLGQDSAVNETECPFYWGDSQEESMSLVSDTCFGTKSKHAPRMGVRDFTGSCLGKQPRPGRGKRRCGATGAWERSEGERGQRRVGGSWGGEEASGKPWRLKAVGSVAQASAAASLCSVAPPASVLKGWPGSLR